MTRTQCTLDLMLFLQRWPRAFAEIRRRYPDAAERTIYRTLADVRAVAGLDVDDPFVCASERLEAPSTGATTSGSQTCQAPSAGSSSAQAAS